MSTAERWKLRFLEFEKAYNRLIEAKKRIKNEPKDELIRTGYIHTYNFTIELAWKTIKEFLEAVGFQKINSPKNVIRQAYQEGTIKDVEIWLKALMTVTTQYIIMMKQWQ